MIDFISEWISRLDTPTFFIYATFWAAVSIYCCYRAFYALHKKRIIKDTPTSWLRSAAQGYTELVGRGLHMDGPPITSPLSGRECLWYRIKTEEIGSEVDGNRFSGDGLAIFALFSLFSKSPGVKRGNTQESDDLFYLDDETGRCVIDPEGAHITPSLTRSWYGNSPVPDRGPALSRSSIGYRYKYTEELLLPGDILYAIGNLQTLGGAGMIADMKEEVRDLLNHWKKDQATLLSRFDRNNDGEISQSEWKNARKAAAQEIADKHTSNDVPPVVTMMKNTHDRRRPFMISSDPVHGLVDRFHRHSLTFFIASLITSGAVVWAFSIRL